MKNTLTRLILISVLAAVPHLAASEYNLQELAETDGLALFNRSCQTDADTQPGIVYLNAEANDGLAWINDARFSEGTIEIEIKGANRPGRSFVGLAFNGQDNHHYEAIYLRPFNFKNPDREQHSLQYISSPVHHWKSLRTQHPGKYESAITPAPDPESWVKLTIVIKGNSLEVFINDSDTPELSVDRIGKHSTGKIGLWLGNRSDGEFRNLKLNEEADQHAK